MATITGFHHVVLTVTDVERSVTWYEEVLGFTTAVSRDSDDARLRVLVHPASGVLLGLRQPLAPVGDRFDELRTGLDHVAFTVGTADELRSWEEALARKAVAFSPTAATAMGSVIVLRDPDDIQLELYLPAPS